MEESATGETAFDRGHTDRVYTTTRAELSHCRREKLGPFADSNCWNIDLFNRFLTDLHVAAVIQSLFLLLNEAHIIIVIRKSCLDQTTLKRWSNIF